MQKFIVLCSALFFGAFFSYSLAQKVSLSGTIYDDSGQPLRGAHVYLQGTNIGTATNNKGNYILQNLKPAGYVLNVSFSGFKHVKDSITLTSGSNKHDYQLNESVNGLGEVVITGTGTPHHLKNAPVPTELLTSKAISSVGANDFTELMMALSPSFDFNPGTMGAFMTINGLRNDFIVVLINGRRTYGDMGGNSDLSRINPENIERIEILKGAASLLYGSDAIAGVVNIITKESRQNIHISNTTRLGFYNTWQQNNTIDFNLGKVSTHTSFSRKSSDGWQLSRYEEDEGALIETDEKAQKAYDDYTLRQEIVFKATEKLSFYVDGSAYEKDMYRERSVAGFGYNFEDYTYGAGARYLLKDKDYIFADYHHDQYLYYYKYNQDNNGFEKGDKSRNNDQRLDNLRLKYVSQLSANNRLTLGLDYLKEQMFSDGRVIEGEASANALAAYVQDEITFFEALDIVAGLRYVKHKEFGSAFTPKMSILYSPGNFNLRGTYGLGYKAPTLKELYYHYEKRGRLYLGNPDLDPQTSTYTSFGVEYDKSGLSFSVTGYRNDVNDLIDYQVINPESGDKENGINIRKKHFNIEEARSQGVDVLMNLKAGYGFTIGGGYSYVDAGNLTTDEGLEGVAEHYGNVRLLYDYGRPGYYLNISFTGRLQDDKYYDDGNAMGYAVWDLTSNHTFTKIGDFTFALTAGIDNIFGFVDDSPFGGHYGTLTPGRTLFIKLKVNFSK
ncbi:TonB-dependent receptor [Marinilabilia rubra]|uniref:TonB-dependent receptor n=1 Tax=Marinilabilia rubra TaxID=2162893 RepID=A0A2U2B5U1_9BACT|nr:TonB-dependent receptor [Marinilabilia rubra]PWD98425.1 TonB-dependent receptor [Marinilabilia rubra]